MPGRNRQPHPPRGGQQQSSASSSQNNAPNRSRPHGPSRPQRQVYRGPDDRPVPAYSAIKEGTAVSLVLKVDQPTGRQVQGFVAELLTRGDHPRGVKVRLRDGRVGRVQRLISEAEGAAGEESVGGAGANLGRDGDAGFVGRGTGARGGRGGYRHEKDVREDDEYLFDEDRIKERDTGLFAQLEEADRNYRASKGGGHDSSDMATCPVCGEYEGDERAVAFHVEGHFAEG